MEYPKLTYSGNNILLSEAILKANRLLSNTEFYEKIKSIHHFDNANGYTGEQIVKEMLYIESVVVYEYKKRWTSTTAITQDQIGVNMLKLNRYSDHKRNIASITNTLIHEFIHAVDWKTNQKWDYTHRTQYAENPPISAPYVIGEIAEKYYLELQ